MECDKCGLCCENVYRNPIFASLTANNGSCIYFDASNKLCSIYEDRPTICRVDEGYEMIYHDILNKKDYYELNRRACELLKKGEETKHHDNTIHNSGSISSCGNECDYAGR